MDKLVDMALTKAELKEESNEGLVSPSGDQSPYPWGLSLSLERRELTKLGIKELPGIGDELHLDVIAKVTSVNANLRTDGDDESRVGLQITMMAVELDESSAEEKGEKETPATEAAETKSVLGKYRS